MRKLFKHSSVVLSLLLASCTTPQKYDYTNFKQSRPASILVLPPLNESPDVKATYTFLSTVTMPLAESGYYVFPVALVDSTFKENGLSQPAEMHGAPPQKLREIFGADAALYITIKQYGQVYKVFVSENRVSASAKLVDLKTNTVLWEGSASASDQDGHSNNNGLLTTLVVALVTQIASTVKDNGRAVSKITSSQLLSAKPNGLLYGPRSPKFKSEPSEP